MKFEWETIDAYYQRAKVPGGWLVTAREDVMHNLPDGGLAGGWDWHVAMCFVPDSNWSWEINN